MEKRYLSVAPEIAAALEAGEPVVALESTILSHGMPWPENREFAGRVEEIVRGEGAVPATTAILDGKLKVGLSPGELELMCRADGVGKVSRRDVPVYLAAGKAGATTVATTMMLAAMAGIRVFATGGIGGVHRGAESSFDISADLEELARTPVAVVCAGAKSLLDIPKTLEYLETKGVPVLGMGSWDFPAFYCRKSGCRVDYALSGPEEAARILRAKWELGLTGGAVIANPIPAEYELDFEEMEEVIARALEAAREAGIRGKDTTPFLLARIKEYTGGKALASNLQLAYNNARTAAKIAVELCRLEKAEG